MPFFGAINQLEQEELTFSMKGDRENIILAVQYRRQINIYVELYFSSNMKANSLHNMVQVN